MQFNPDRNKQAEEVTFSKKTESKNSFSLTFKKTKVGTCQCQKDLVLIPDEQLVILLNI